IVAQKTIARQAQSSWAYADKNGKLVYKTTAAGDRLADFSYAGYMGGGVALPFITTTLVLHPSGKDDTEAIQAAINEIAAKPLVDGFRGAVELAPGNFTCSATITIPASGIVLRGSGPGKNGTAIWMTGSRHTAIVIGKNAAFTSSENEEAPPASQQPAERVQTQITNVYVPSGTRIFTVTDAASFVKGDLIEIKKPVTDAW